MAVTRGLSKAIGLGTEAYAHHKAKKSQENLGNDAGEAPNQTRNTSLAEDVAPPTSHSRPIGAGPKCSDAQDAQDAYDEDEYDWIRDETEAQLQPGGYQDLTVLDGRDVDALVAQFLQRHPLKVSSVTASQLHNPVIIPQRRPGTKFRGFVPAYAPALDACGVDENAFMELHDGMHNAINKQGWFHVSNIAVGLSALSYTVAVAPSIIVHATAVAVHTSIEASRRLWMAKKTNNYLDEMNEQYFKPRGLYALIMTYKPGSKDPEQLVDIRTHVSSSVAGRDSHSRSGFKTSSGKTHGEAQMPEAAPLIFPKLEQADDQQKQNAFKRASDFMSDYGDKRAQAEFVSLHHVCKCIQCADTTCSNTNLLTPSSTLHQSPSSRPSLPIRITPLTRA